MENLRKAILKLDPTIKVVGRGITRKVLENKLKSLQIITKKQKIISSQKVNKVNKVNKLNSISNIDDIFIKILKFKLNNIQDIQKLYLYYVNKCFEKNSIDILFLHNFITYFAFLLMESVEESSNKLISDLIINMVMESYDVMLMPISLTKELIDSMYALFGELVFDPQLVGNYLPIIVLSLENKNPYAVNIDISKADDSNIKYTERDILETVSNIVLDGRFIDLSS